MKHKKDTETEFVPFGPEWEKVLMKLPKKAIIDLYRRNAKELLESKVRDRTKR